MPRGASDDRRWSSADVPGEAVDARATRATRATRRERDDDATTASARTTRARRGRPPRARRRGRRCERANDATTTARDDAAPSVLQKLQKWGDYESCGDVVRGTRLIPMKTPLSPRYVEENCVNALTMESLMRGQRARGREIGLIIDLTNHDCLYEDDIPSDVARVHVRNVAKAVPSASDVRKATEAANKFLATAGNENKYIAVHCAYGFNRTGFVICCYLVQMFGATPAEAMELFAEARPPGLKHLHFRHELVERYAPSETRGDSDSPIDALSRLRIRRSFDSEPDFRNAIDDEDENDTLDIEMNRKHWRAAP